ncbi:MAG TPA: hypothetical protein VIL15_03780 [Coriobacteriia bacterium]
MSLFARSFLKWLPIAVGCTLVLGISYVFVQQSYRMGANDPQTMVAHDTAAALAAGSQPDQLVSNETIDPSVSLAPFVIVFDAAGKPLVSSARLAGTIPVPPAGVLEASKASGENKVTWKPRSDARIAAVVVPVKGGADGFVLAGRSLRVVEERVNDLTSLALLGWAATMLTTFTAVLFVGWVRARRKRAMAA